MPPTARDLYFAVRVEDRATGPLRRISSEMRRMSGTSTSAAANRARAQARQQALASQRMAERAEISSLSGGAKRQQLNKSIAAEEAKTANALSKTESIGRAINANTAKRVLYQNQLKQLGREYARAQVTGETKGRSITELRAAAQRISLLQMDAMQNQQRLYRDLENAQRTYSKQAISGARAISAAEADAARQLKFHTARYYDLGKAELAAEQNTRRLAQIEQGYLRQENLQKWSARARVVEHLGHAITLLGVAATAAFGAAAHAAAQFQTSATLAATQARQPGAPAAAVPRITQQLNTQVLRQMREFPAASEEMNKALYDIFSGTNIQNVDRAAKLLRIFNMEAVAGGTDLDTMVQAGITLFNNFPGQFANATTAGNKFFAMVRFGRGSAAQFAAALNPIIPIAKQAGQSFDDVSTTLAFLSRQSRDVTQNAQGYARLLLLLARPEVRAGFKKIGIDVTDSQGRVRNLLNIVTELRDRVKLKPVEALTFFKTISEAATGRGTAGTIQAQRVWARLVEHVDEYRKVSKLVLADNNEFIKSYQAMSQTPGVRWAVFINQLKALALQIGSGAIPAFAKLGREVSKAIDWFNGLSPSTRRAIGYFGAFIAIATAVGGVVLTLGAGLASLFLTLGMLVGARGLAALERTAASSGAQLGTLGAEAGFISVRFGILGAAAAALLYIFIKYPSAFHQATSALGGTRHAIELLLTVLTATAIAKRLGIFAAINKQALGATGIVNSLRFALMRLGAIGAIAIAIDLIIRAHREGGIKRNLLNELQGRPGLGPLGVQDDIMRALGIGRRGRNIVRRVTSDVMTGGAAEVTRALFGWGKDRQYISPQERQQMRARQNAIERELNKQFDAFINVRKQGQARITALGAAKFDVQPTARFGRVFTEYEQARRQVARANRAIEQAPTFAASNRAYEAAAEARLRFTRAQKALNTELESQRGSQAVNKFKELTQTAEQLGVTKITPSFMALFDNLRRTRRLATIAQKALELNPSVANSRRALQAWTVYQRALKLLQDNATKEQISAAKKAADGVETAQRRSIAKQKDDLKTAIDNVSQMYEDMLQKNQQTFGQLFSGPWLTSALVNFRREWGVMPTGGDLLKDLRGQVSQFQRFNRTLNTLQRRGAPPELIKQLRELGPEALPNIIALTKLQPAQWKAYVAAFKQGQDLIKAQTKADLNAQLSLYKSFGNNVAKSIILGIREQSTPMRSEIRSLVLKMFPELGPHHPARNPRQQARPPAAPTPHRPPAPRPPTHRRPAPTGPPTGVKHGDTYHYHDHTTIKTEPGETLGTTLRRARFEQKHRPRRKR